MHLLALTVGLLAIFLDLKLQLTSAQEIATAEKQIALREGKTVNVLPKPEPVRRQVGNIGSPFDGRNYQQFPSFSNPGGSGGLNYGLVGINGGLNLCSTCSAADYSLAQKCCSLGQRSCCSINQIYPQPVVFASGGNGGFGFQNPGSSSWRPSSPGFGGITYDTQYSTGGGYSGFNRGQKPGICYRGSYQNQGGYAGQVTGGYQSVSYPQSSYGSTGGYYYPQSQGYQVPAYNQNRYCRTDYECNGNQKCCTGICSNPAFFA